MTCRACAIAYQLLLNTLLIIDKAGNTVLLGDPNQTLSARAARARLAGSKPAAAFCAVLTWIGNRFSGHGDHCTWAISDSPSIGAEIWHWSPPPPPSA